MTAPRAPLPAAYDALVVSRCPDVLQPFNLAGVLHPGDVHAAVTLCRLAGCDDPEVLLATALAVRGPRVGHVCVDLDTAAETVTGSEDGAEEIRALPWPEDPADWLAAVRAAGSLVAAAGAPGDHERPLTLDGSRLYLDRYWRYEQLVADALTSRAAQPVPYDADVLRSGLDALFAPVDDGPDLQRVAAATAVTRALAVIAGGPGTGKTTTVARVLALLDQQQVAADSPPLRIALAAPTGKAAARLEESLREALARPEFDDAARERLAATEASTIHRLLGRRGGTTTRFRHHADQPLPHDVVVVDEASMVSLSLMAKLLDALPARSRFVLVGDPQQLRSVEAGAVLGDIVGPALQASRIGEAARAELLHVTGQDLGRAEVTEPAASAVGDGIVVLRRVHRFGEASGIAELAAAIQRGDPEATLDILRAGRPDVQWVQRDDEATDEADTPLDDVRDRVVEVGTRVRSAARSGDAVAALAGVEELRVLCAHRRGPFGVDGWVPRIERWLGTDTVVGYAAAEWPAGRPVMATVNDHQLRVYNGDVGVVVATDAGPRVAFAAVGGPRLVSPTRLTGLETVHAMTIHKSQGSQFAQAVVVLPTDSSRIVSRELLYTGVTRAIDGVTVIGSAATVRAAVQRQVQRASGLRDRLWGDGS